MAVEDPDSIAPPRFWSWWCLWLNGVRPLTDFVPGVREVWMVKPTCGESGFWFKVEDGGQFLMTFCNGAGGLKVQGGWGNFGQQIDWDE